MIEPSKADVTEEQKSDLAVAAEKHRDAVLADCIIPAALRPELVSLIGALCRTAFMAGAVWSTEQHLQKVAE